MATTTEAVAQTATQVQNAAQAVVKISDNMKSTTDNVLQMVGTGSNRVYGDGAAAVERVYTDAGNVAGQTVDVAGKAATAVGNSIDNLYQTFTNTVLPAVGQGLVITKDYFVDLFSRYAMYLAITDGVMVIIELAAFFFSYRAIKNAFEFFRSDVPADDGAIATNVIKTFGGIIVGIIAVAWFTTDFPNFIKDVTIPELRVGEQLLDYKAKLGK